MITKKNHYLPTWRRYFLLLTALLAFISLGYYVIRLQTIDHERLKNHGNARYLRELIVPAQRGRILDRNGNVLAVSTPVESLWATPSVFCHAQAKWRAMLEAIEMREQDLNARCKQKKNAAFMYIKRHLPPMLAEQIMQLSIPGVGTRREYKRYYPSGPAGAHLIGFTNIDDVGQEGLEYAHEVQLKGVSGRVQVLKDSAGNYVERVENKRQVEHGKDLIVSIDQRIQSLASEYLEFAVQRHKAVGGSVVVLLIPSGEILAMVNSPQFNPNDRQTMTTDKFRNRSITDLFEPGSTVKPLTVAFALGSDTINAETMIDTTPGTLKINAHTIRDIKNHGKISVHDVIAFSSTVGVSKIALQLPYQDLVDAFKRFGFGTHATDLPGDARGTLKKRSRSIDHASLSYGYGLSVTPLQLARAYTVFATDGILLPVTLEPKSSDYQALGTRVFTPDTIQKMRKMLKKVVSQEGTASKARVPRYQVGGKTGTTHKFIDGRYNDNRYVSAFAGIAPLSDPRFVVVVMVNDPRRGEYFGGDVAAPVFAELINDLLRLYNVEPDALTLAPTTSASIADRRAN